MRHLVTLVAVLVAGPASASDRGGVMREPARTRPEPTDPFAEAPPAPIRIGDFTVDGRARSVDRADATIHVRRAEVVVALALTVRGRDASPRIGALSLTLPPGATATGLELVAEGAVVQGEPLAMIDARMAYDQEVARLKDPALLEYAETTTGGHTRLRLGVAPLVADPVRVTVTIRVPRTGAGTVALHVDAPGSIELAAEAGAAERLAIAGRARGTTSARARRGTRPILVEFGAAAAAVWLTESVITPRAVDAETSLLALLPGESHATRYSRGTTVPYPGMRSGKDIRKVVRLHLPRVAHCYQLAIQREPTEGGTAQASWMIYADGSVGAVAVDGTADAALRACIAGVLAGMTFTADGSGDTLVRYPFHLEPRVLAPPADYADLAADLAAYEAEKAAQAPR
jgi:hypothetical protein